MAVNAGEVSVALLLDDAAFSAGLEAARASLEEFAGEVAALAAAPEVSAPSAELPETDASAQFEASGASAGTSFGAGVAAAIAAAAPVAAVAMEGLAASTATALAAAGLQATQAGAQFALGYATGIGSGAPLAAGGALNVSGAAIEAARGRMSAASAAGRAFTAGLAGGISAGRSGVISAAISVASAAADAARSALAIHSPSKVTREMGEAFDLGFIRGVDGMRPDVERSVRGAVRVEPPANFAVGMARERENTAQPARVSFDYERLADAMSRRQMVLTMDNRRLAQLQERETARAQTMRSRRLALGYGK